MGDKRFLQVESKSFELVKTAFDVNIIERGRKHMSNVLLGFAAVHWFRDALLEVVKLSNDQNLFRLFREGNKVFVIQKQRNSRGSFVSVTVLRDSKGRGCVIIPEGRDACGWRGISHEIDILLLPKVIEQHGVQHRRPEVGNSTANGYFGKESQTFKEAVIVGGNIPKISHMDSGVNIEMHHMGNGLVNESTEISLKIILGIGQKNNWEVKWAGVIDELSREPGLHQHKAQPTDQPKHVSNTLNTANPTFDNVRPNVSRPNSSKTGPITTQVWKPRAAVSHNVQKPLAAGSQTVQKSLDVLSESNSPRSTRSDGEHVSVHSCNTDSQTSTTSSLVPAARPIAELMKGIGEVDRSWGSSSDWFLDLRDGRRLRIPIDLRTPMAKSHQDEEIARKLVEWVSVK
jgi:hypothetical protein